MSSRKKSLDGGTVQTASSHQNLPSVSSPPVTLQSLPHAQTLVSARQNNPSDPNAVIKASSRTARSLSRAVACTLFVGFSVAVVLAATLAATAFVPPPPVSGHYADNLSVAPFVLDVGTVGDDNSANGLGIYMECKTAGCVSSPMVDTMGTPGDDSDDVIYRNLASGKSLRFYVDASSIAVSSNGVPYTHALVEVGYYEHVDSNGKPFAGTVKPSVYTGLTRDPEGWASIGRVFGHEEGVTWRTATITIESSPFQTLETCSNGDYTTCFQFTIYNGSGQSFSIDSFTFRFVDDQTFYEIRNGTDNAGTNGLWNDRGFIRHDHQRVTSEDSVDAVDYSPAAYVLFSNNYLDPIFPNSIPTNAQVENLTSNGLSLMELAGEYEPLTFGIYAFQNISGVRVQATDLTAHDAIIHSENIELNTVEFMPARWSGGRTTGKSYYGDNPMYLYPLADEEGSTNSFAVPQDECRQVWATLHVPDDAVPGHYTGKITVTVDGQAPTEIDVAVDVAAIDLDDEDTTTSVYWSPYRPTDGVRYAENDDTAALSMAAHGLKPMIYFRPVIDVPSNIKDLDPKETVDIDFEEYGHVHELNALHNYGLLDDVVQIRIQDNREELWDLLCNSSYPDSDDAEAGDLVCEAFDDYYTVILRRYRDFFTNTAAVPGHDWSVTPIVRVKDESKSLGSVQETNHMNRLAHKAGLRTYITYYSSTENPYAGLEFTFTGTPYPIQTQANRQPPSWISDNESRDPNVLAYWNFSSGTDDVTGNGNDFTCMNGATTNGEALILPSTSAYAITGEYPHLDITTNGTVCFWLKREQEPTSNSTQYLRKKTYSDFYNYGWRHWSQSSSESRTTLFQGEHSSPDPNKNLSYGMKLTAEPTQHWFHILWIYEANGSSRYYINGVPTYSRYGKGELLTNTDALRIGGIQGQFDEAYILDRALTNDEIADAIANIARPDESIVASMNGITADDINDMFAVDNAIDFSVFYGVDQLGETETLKTFGINGVTLWSSDDQSIVGNSAPVSITPQDLSSNGVLLDVSSNSIWFRIDSRGLPKDNVSVYFHEQILRYPDPGSPWMITTNGDGWTHKFDEDANGDLAPMSTYLDQRTYNMRDLTDEEYEEALSLDKDVTIYTTYLATAPAIHNNRFLHGICGSALGFPKITVYGFAGWTHQPFDEMTESGEVGKTTNRGSCDYILGYPSWQDRLYPALAYESLREGVEDSRVIATLKGILDNVDTRADYEIVASTAADAQQFLEDVFGNISTDFSGRYWPVDRHRIDSNSPLYAPEKYASRSDEMLEDICTAGGDTLNNSICDDLHDFNAFDNVRATMIDFILQMTDSDGDGLYDIDDNCPSHPNPGQYDCDSNGLGDVCEIAHGLSTDLNSNGLPDDCETDCNTNAVPDDWDITIGTSQDCNTNGLPDECEPGGSSDCNTNSIPDLCDIYYETSADCNANTIPDECEDLVYGVIYVDDDATSGLNDGTSWDNAYTDLESALDHARCAGSAIQEIQIAQGTYYPNTNGLVDPRTAHFEMVNGVSILGGYEGVGSAVPERRRPSIFVVTISGDIGIPGNSTDNCYHVFYHPAGLNLDETAVLDGVTITGGSANGLSEDHQGYGGALCNEQTSKPTMRNCRFVDNFASTRGGAVCNDQGCNLLIEDCLFQNNTCSGSGGAVYNHLSGPTCTRCEFVDNWAGSDSGAMYCSGAFSFLTDCVFVGNSTSGSAGAMYGYEAGLTFINCLFSGNSASVDAGAIRTYSTLLRLINSTFNDHYAGAYGGTLDTFDSVLIMTNSVIWNSNPTAIRNQYPIHLDVSNSCVEGGFAGTGNIDSDPLFIDPNGADDVAGTIDDNLRLSAGSPCIDAGSNSDVPADTQDLDDDEDTLEQLPWDLDDNDRFVDDPATTDTGTGTAPIVDMGAYEFWPDCNSNGIIDYIDIGDISTDCNSNNIPDECEPDCNANGIADECDIANGTSLDLNTNGLPDECEPAPPTLTDAQSLKTHGSPGTTYSISAPDTECRHGGITSVKLCFDKIAYSTNGDDFVAGDFTLSRGTIRGISTAWNDGVQPVLAQITLDISGVTTMGQLTISFSAQNSVGLEQQYSPCWNYVPADVDSDGDVDSTDGAIIENADGDPLFLNYRCDLDLDGVIDGVRKDGEDWAIWSGTTPILQQVLCGW